MGDDSGSSRRALPKLGAGLTAGRGVATGRRLVGFVLPVAIGAALTILVYVTLTERERSEKVARFEVAVSAMATALQANLDLEFETLLAIPPFFAASDEVTRSDFSLFVRPAMRRYQGVYAFQWLPRITAADRVAFETLLRTEGHQDSGLQEMVDDEDTQSAAARAEYFPVLYGEPAIQAVFGLDLASHPEQGPYYRRACTGEHTVATPPLSLIEDPPDVLSVIAIHPVRLQGTRARESCDGLAMMILRVNPVVTQAIGEEVLREFSIALTVENAAGTRQPVFQSVPGGAVPDGSPNWTEATREIRVSDQMWTLRASPASGAQLAPGGSLWIVLPVGWLLSGLAGFGIAASVTITGLRRSVDTALELGQYKLGRKLGEGGMGSVFEAKHHLLARPAAIKLIKQDLTGGTDQRVATDAVQRFKREAQAIASLRSPHTVGLFDFGTADNGAFYFAMELLDGLDADTLVRRFGPVPAERAIHLLSQVCHSLSEAHSRGLVHRDIKPANVFVCRYGEELDFVKVLDFGIVKESRGEPGDPGLTNAGAIQGTPAFVSPEQATGSADLDRRSDIYATGCLAYWLLTAQHVFTADTPVELLVHHIQTDPAPPSTRTELSLPPPLDEIILACLAKDPAERPQTARELARRLSTVELKAEWSEERAREWWALHQAAEV